MLWSHDGVDGTRVAARQEFSKSGRSEKSSNKVGGGGQKRTTRTAQGLLSAIPSSPGLGPRLRSRGQLKANYLRYTGTG